MSARVVLHGRMTQKCPVAGCWFMLHDETGTIKVDTKNAGFVVVDIPLQSSKSSLDISRLMELRKLSTPRVCDTDMRRTLLPAILFGPGNIAPRSLATIAEDRRRRAP